MQIKRTNRVKRAARAKGRRKGKTPKNLLYQNPKAIKDDTFKEKFDKRRTYLQNMNSFNLKDMYYDKLPEVIPQKAEWTLPKVNEEELNVCKKLAEKYGKEVPTAADEEEQEELQNEFFSRMARDKLNVYQWTWGQLRKKFNLALEGRVHVCHADCQCALAKQSSNVKKYQGVRIHRRLKVH
ncbi:hypothetical protein Pmar_PMAR010248 [Perkinsus marinus ATCC 50983]|uniref:Nucleolar protein 16 n=1 Tax=Perkinsus marinus (strain ATCC 50983 / TXsc) TaxID=423536 RepID=C5K580_PERM5|nr:hypothetical protein Pmar_PMAR010248 [Perkinsus marinus ATCC 50983]EER20502.1 hypothetical protein Pmar_PMAR010248 [Perkinsus marinus ATCC 50983]|eukprot:XP_002788706.1 hypothetical protein Pmar_PMAR010248 [Perkinsus marinus ATCC 50983]